MLARKCSNCNSATSLVGVWNAVLCKTCSYLMCVHVCDEWVTSTMSCPQQPCSAPANSVYGFFYGVSLSHIWSSSAPAAFYFSQHYCLFQTTVSSHDVPKVGQLQFCHFCLQWCFRLNLFEDHFFIFLSVQGIHKTIFQHRISNESIFFLSTVFTVQLSHQYTGIGNVRVWINLAQSIVTHLCSCDLS